jgi:hypothetical protein
MQVSLASVHVTSIYETAHVTLNFNNDMSTAAVFLDIEKAFDTTWHPVLLL